MTWSAGGLSQANLLISASSPDAILGGQQLAQAVEGVATFSSLIITANESIASGPQHYTIQFAAASNPDIQAWSISVNLRCARLKDHSTLYGSCNGKHICKQHVAWQSSVHLS